MPGWRRARARATAWRFRLRPSSPTPVPRPTTASGGRPKRAAVRAAAAVVLPMPMSPAARRVAPSAMARLAASRPARRALSASSGVMAGPWARFAVPGRTLRLRSPGWSGSSPTTPTSRT